METTTDVKMNKSDFIGFKKTNIRDDYKFMKKIGSGSSGVFYKAQHKQTQNLYAVKAVRKRKHPSLKLFLQEIQILKTLDHPNIVKIYDVYENDLWIFLVQDLCEGGELFFYITQRKHLTENEAALIMKQAFSAIQYIHKNNICHRDLKPENFILKKEGDFSSLKLIDFENSQNLDAEEVMNDINGSPYYVAPEILEGNYTKQVDMWSLGVILYLLLCGEPPFQGKSHKHIIRSVKRGEYDMERPLLQKCSLESRDLLQRLLKRNPNQRITPGEAYYHTWIRREIKKEEEKMEIDASAFTELEKFMRAFTLKKVLLLRIAAQIPEEQVQNLTNIFKKIDTNGNGVISKQEMVQGMKVFNKEGKSNLTEKSVKRLFHAIDVDHNGEIGYTEFIASCLDSHLQKNSKHLQAIFKEMDKDGNGTLSREELKKVLYGDGSILTSEEQLDEVIKMADKNGDGEIDYGELIELMGKVDISK